MKYKSGDIVKCVNPLIPNIDRLSYGIVLETNNNGILVDYGYKTHVSLECELVLIRGCNSQRKIELLLLVIAEIQSVAGYPMPEWFLNKYLEILDEERE